MTVEVVYLVFQLGKGYTPPRRLPGAHRGRLGQRRELEALALSVAVGLVGSACWWCFPFVLPVPPEHTIINDNLDKARHDFSAELERPTASCRPSSRRVPGRCRNPSDRRPSS